MRGRGGMGGGQAGSIGGDLHALGCHRGAHAVQSGNRRHGQGTSRPRDRRPGRADGCRDRCDGDPVQAAEPQPRPCGLVSSRAGRQAGLQRVGQRTPCLGTEHRLDFCAGPFGSRRSWTRRGAAAGGRPGCALPGACDHHGNVPERTDSRRPRAAPGWPCRRTAVQGSRGSHSRALGSGGDG